MANPTYSNDLLVHIIQYSLKIPTSMFDSVYKCLCAIGEPFSLAASNDRDRQIGFKNNCVQGVGFILVQKKVWGQSGQTEGYENYLNLLVNPQDIVDFETGKPYSSIALFRVLEENCDIISDYLVVLFHQLGLCHVYDSDNKVYFNLVHRGLESFQVSQIDFCIEIHFQTQVEVEQYLELARQGFCPPITDAQNNDSNAERQIGQCHNEVVFHGEPLNIIVQNKYEQLKEHYREVNELVEEGLGILRLAIRVERDKISWAQGCDPNYYLLLRFKSLTADVFEVFSKKIFFTGNYICHSRLPEVLFSLVEDGTLKEKDLPELTAFLEEVHAEKSVTPVAMRYISRDMAKYRRICQKLDKCHINPVMAPNKVFRKQSVVDLPSIPRLLGFVEDSE